jgi:ribosomal-protein-alanine N-acetyltransferase
MQAKIKKLNKNNIKDVVAISNEQLGEEAWTESQYNDCIENKSYINYVLYFNDDVVAFLIAQNLTDSINLLLVATKKEYKKMGFASLLINKLLQEAKKQNIKTWLEVKKTNLPAINLYTKLGFQLLYERAKYYKDGSPALILEKI